MYSKGSFHPKLWLLKFETGVLRVVISSANLYMGDWSVWGNQLWFKDFHIKSTTRIGGAMDVESGVKRVFKAKEKRIRNDFQEYLQFFLSSILKDKPEILNEFCSIKLDDYTMDGEELPFIIGSVNGYHDLGKKGLKMTGLGRLGQICQNFKFKSSNPRDYRIFYQASSLGNPSMNMLLSIISKIKLYFNKFLSQQQLYSQIMIFQKTQLASLTLRKYSVSSSQLSIS